MANNARISQLLKELHSAHGRVYAQAMPGPASADVVAKETAEFMRLLLEYLEEVRK